MIAQRGPGVLSAESATALQDGHDMIDERRELVRQCRSHERESVDSTCVLPSDHMIGQLLGSADEMRRPAPPVTCWATSRKGASGFARAAA